MQPCKDYPSLTPRRRGWADGLMAYQGAILVIWGGLTGKGRKKLFIEVKMFGSNAEKKMLGDKGKRERTRF